VNLYCNILLTYVVSHIYCMVLTSLTGIVQIYQVLVMLSIVLCVKFIKWNFSCWTVLCIYDFTNKHDIVHDISFRRRRFKLKLLSSCSNNSVIKLLRASIWVQDAYISSVGLSQVSAKCFYVHVFFSFVYICLSVCDSYCVMRWIKIFVMPLIEMCGCDWFKSRHVV